LCSSAAGHEDAKSRLTRDRREDNTLQGLDKKKLGMALALCVIGIGFAIYMAVHTFVQPKPFYPAGFNIKYGPGGPPNARSTPPGSTPGPLR
jgi:hypothetical protein